jgi:uncharacterized membrane protein YfcA
MNGKLALMVPELSPAGWLLAGLAVVLIGLAKSGFGGGVGILAVPMFVFAVGDPRRAVGIMLPILILADIFSVYHHWKTWDNRNLKLLWPGSALGILLGAWVLYAFGKLEGGERIMKMIIGLICVLYVLLDQVRRRWAPQWHLKPGVKSGTGTGLAAGTTSTLAHAAGPIAAIYLLGQKLPKQAFIGTTVIYFFSVNVAKLVPYGWLGMINTDTLWQGLWLLPLVPVGTYMGAHLNRRLSETLFRNIILIIIFLTGLKMVVFP